MHLPTLILNNFTEWELDIINPFLDNSNRIIPRIELILLRNHQYPTLFVYQTVLDKLYRDRRFSVPLMWNNDPFLNPFKKLFDSGNLLEFRTLLEYEPILLLKLIDKVIYSIDPSSAYPNS